MKFLVDQDVYAATIRLLRRLVHDVVPVAQLGMSQTDDLVLLHTAKDQGRVLVARDRDFGGLVFVEFAGVGDVYLRMLPSTQQAVHAEFERVLDEHTESELLNSFVVIEPGRHRYRRSPP